MSIIPQIAKQGAGTGSGGGWKVSADSKAGTITLTFGTFFYNGKFFTTNDIESGTDVDLGKSVTLQQSILGGYVYLDILHPLSVPDETSDSLKIKIDISTNFKAHHELEDTIKSASLVQHIPLAYIDNDGKVTDLRPQFTFASFAFLGPGQS